MNLRKNRHSNPSTSDKASHHRSNPPNVNAGVKRKLIDELGARELGLRRRLSVSYQSSQVHFLLRHNLLHCWNRRAIDIGEKNKVFACSWLTPDHVIYGTKCNKLSVLEINTGREYSIPLLRNEYNEYLKKSDSSSSLSSLSIDRSDQPALPRLDAALGTGTGSFLASSSPVPFDACQSGIHAITHNPSNTMLATGGENVWDVGLYRLPDLTPYSVLTGAHKDWVFDLCWIDDEFLVSCSRDTSLALWRANPDERPLDKRHSDGHGIDTPVCKVKSVISDDRFRAVDYSREYNVLGVLTMSSRLYLYDPVRLMDNITSHSRLTLNSDIRETVALRRCPSRPELLSVCSQRAVVCLDVRCPSQKGDGFKVYSKHGDCGIRSVNFQGDLLSYGTSQGGILFYDIRARQHISATPGGFGELTIGSGWVQDYPGPPHDSLGFPAIYTHEYDPGGTRLFAAGGPIAAAYHGNAACIWE